mgnify:CR=1 FL=1
MNEWEFVSVAASWMTSAAQANPDLPFGEARCEQTGRGSRKRRDLTLLGRDGRRLVTGEVKMPFQPEGSSPYRDSVVKDARAKAKRAQVKWFFTWNVNRCVLWPTEGKTDPGGEREYRAWDVADVHSESQLELAMVGERIKRWIPLFLHDVAEVLRGRRAIEKQPPDARFVDGLEAALEQPILLTTTALNQLWRKAPTRNELRRWMAEEQGWTLHDPDDKDGVLEDLNRAAHFGNYALVNKLVFHEALIRRYGSELDPIQIPDHISEAEPLMYHFEGFFAKAREVTRDYETVFGEDHRNVGNRIPFYNDDVVDFWRVLLEQVHEFDFSRIDYEIIGSIFERLISPEERHKFGQYYTRAEVVDLINSYCIRSGKEKVMDPACGGGTFLVRAYARKRHLNVQAEHADRLKDLFGIDLSHFATHLTTINLATRDLIDAENYPQIARSDFFDIEPGQPLMNLPSRITTSGLGTGQSREVSVPPLDAVVGNPPYIRQEQIPRTPAKNNNPRPGTKEFYKQVAELQTGINLSGRSDIHVYFWLHATKFLHDGGWLGFLTSSQWLDVEYGFRLQEFILRNFEVHAVFESIEEPWFVGARVATCATLLRRQKDERQRMEQIVRFVQLRRPLAEVLEHDGTAAGAAEAADRFRDTLQNLTEDTVGPAYRVRLVKQGELWNDGVRLGKLLGKSDTDPDASDQRQQGSYYGGKWGTFLRAPDIWFDLLDKAGDRLAPLGEIAEVRFGVKSGKDAFFFPIDASDQALADYPDAEGFKDQFGAARKQVEDGRVKIVWCGEGRGELRPIEAEFLEPLLHNLKDLDEFTVTRSACAKSILLTGCRTDELPRHAKAYVRWGEENKWDHQSTCQSRATERRDWHDLTGHVRGTMFWSMRHGYRHIAPVNEPGLQCNKAFFDVVPHDVDTPLLAGILNSTFVVLSKNVFGRPVGVEGYWATEVTDAKAMLVPDPRTATPAARKRVAKAFGAMKQRKALGFVSERRLRRVKYQAAGRARELEQLSDETELDQRDRWALDDAVLQMMGIRAKDERQRILDALYAHLRQHFEWVRLKEERAIVNKKKAKRRGPASPATIAAEIVEQIKDSQPELMQSWSRHFMEGVKPFDTYDLPLEGSVEVVDDLIHQNTLKFSRGRRTTGMVEAASLQQAALVRDLAEAGVRGLVRVPHEPDAVERVHGRFRRWMEQREQAIRELIEQRTGDEELQERIYASLNEGLSVA